MQSSHEAIQLAAYYHWEQRGCPLGEPEADWFWAEEEVSPAKQPSVIAALAEVVGSVLGSVAGVAASVGNLVRSE